MTITDALQQSIKIFDKKIIATPLLDAQVLLSFILKKNKEFLFTYPQTQLTTSQEKKYLTLIKKRATGFPVAYLIKNKEFFGLDFYVNQNVLIPRPATEELVEKIIMVTKKDSSLKNIADIGTGSGAIIISLSKKLGTNKNYYATDICKKALLVAGKNALHHQTKITFLSGNLLEPIKNKKINLIVANLPYLPSQNAPISALTNGLKFEPSKALYAGEKGLDKYQEFFEQLAQLKFLPKYIFLEIFEDQPNEIKKLVKHFFVNAKIKIHQDLSGLNRFVEIILFSKNHYK